MRVPKSATTDFDEPARRSLTFFNITRVSAKIRLRFHHNNRAEATQKCAAIGHFCVSAVLARACLTDQKSSVGIDRKCDGDHISGR
jgi:hypothetical protein